MLRVWATEQSFKEFKFSPVAESHLRRLLLRKRSSKPAREAAAHSSGNSKTT